MAVVGAGVHGYYAFNNPGATIFVTVAITSAIIGILIANEYHKDLWEIIMAKKVAR